MTNVYFILAMASLMLLSGCANKAVDHNNVNSTLWVQTAAEYQANSLQVYNAARIHVDQLKDNRTWTAILEQGTKYSDLPPAIIMDIDETVLDNSPYQAQLILDQAEFDSVTWDKWVSMKAAPAVPGAVDFINEMAAKRVEVIYITNRQCASREGQNSPCPQKQETIDNLHKVGIKAVSANNVLLQDSDKGWTSEKKSRREEVAKSHRILMLFGDDLGDFLPNVKKNIGVGERRKLVMQYQDRWGTSWFTFANPTYGSWMRILEAPLSTHLNGYKE